MQLDHSFSYHPDRHEYGEAYHGSYQSVYYRFGIEPFENVRWTPVDKRASHMLRAYVWEEPYFYYGTGEEKRYRGFPYSAEGLGEATIRTEEQCDNTKPFRL